MTAKARILTLAFVLSMAVGGAAAARDESGAYGAALDEHERRSSIVVIDDRVRYGAALDEHERHADGLLRTLIAENIPGM